MKTHSTTGGSLLVSLLSVVAGVGLSGCGKSPENESFPPGTSEVPVNTTDKIFYRWKLMLEALRIDPGLNVKSEDELKKLLAKPSGLFAANDEYQALLGKVAVDFNKTYYASKCGSVTSLARIGSAKKQNPKTGQYEDLAGADVYLMKYSSMKDATLAPEDTVRSGLVVIPTETASKVPLVSFSHGGDSGLTYGTIASLFGDLQTSHIIVAPSFPGEPICKGSVSFATGNCDEAGKWAEASPTKKSPYEGDALELLTMQNCLARAASIPSSLKLPLVDETGKPVLENDTQKDLAPRVQTLAKRIEGSGGSAAQLPLSFMVGASRGSLTASVALARSGAFLQAERHVKDPNTLPSLYSCNLDVFGPKTFLSTNFRIGLEAFVRGYGDNTRYIQLPTANELFEKWSAYGKGVSFTPGQKLSDVENAKIAAVEAAKIDMPLLAPLILGSVQNWAKYTAGNAAATNRGAMLSIHGLYDAVVPVSQSLFGATVFSGVNASIAQNLADAVPGVSYEAIAVTPPKNYLVTKGTTTTLTGAFVTQHGDRAFAESTVSGSLISCDTATSAEAKSACEAANKATQDKYSSGGVGLSPSEIIKEWLTKSCADASAL